MAAPNPVRIIPATSGNLRAGGEYVIRDEFTTDRAAGAVNGTAAEPGPGTRTVVDTESKLTIAGGALVGGSKATPAWGDPIAEYLGTVIRVAGRMWIATSIVWPSTGRMVVGFSSGTGSNPANWRLVAYSFSDTTLAAGIGTILVATGTLTAGGSYSFAGVYASTGGFVFAKGGTEFPYWTMILRNTLGTENPDRLVIGQHPRYSSLRVPLARWLPTPLVSDGFGSAYGTSDGLGHQEGVAGGIGAGGSGVTFSNAGATWSVSGGKAINTPSLGVTELVTNGNMETGDPPAGWTAGGTATLDGVADERTGGGGAQSLSAIRNTNDTVAYATTAIPAQTWYRLSAWMKNISASSVYVLGLTNDGVAATIAPITSATWISGSSTGRTVAANPYVRLYAIGIATNEARFDDVSARALTLTEILSLSNLACADVLAGAAITRSSVGVQAGLALNWDSPTSPANGVVVFVHSSSIYVDKCVAGTWSNVSNTAYTYSAGARLVCSMNAGALRTYYNNALVKADTIADAGILTGTYHGLFSTDATNTFDDLCIYATGTSGEYAALDAF